MIENKCLYCGEVIVRKHNHGRSPRFCCNKHYWSWYYQENKEHYNKIRGEYHKKHYKPHPIPRKYASKEERYEAQKQKSRERYYNNKEYYRQKNTEWYRKHKDEPDLKRRHALAMKKYHAKRKALKGGENNASESFENTNICKMSLPIQA
jgi:hypothetical protein